MTADNDDDDQCQYNSDLQAESARLVKVLNVNQWVAVRYDEQWYPGTVEHVRALAFVHLS